MAHMFIIFLMLNVRNFLFHPSYRIFPSGNKCLLGWSPGAPGRHMCILAGRKGELRNVAFLIHKLGSVHVRVKFRLRRAYVGGRTWGTIWSTRTGAHFR